MNNRYNDYTPYDLYYIADESRDEFYGDDIPGLDEF
jgi:hypothetical protein